MSKQSQAAYNQQTPRFSFRMLRSELSELRLLAARKGATPSEMVRDALYEVYGIGEFESVQCRVDVSSLKAQPTAARASRIVAI